MQSQLHCFSRKQGITYSNIAYFQNIIKQHFSTFFALKSMSGKMGAGFWALHCRTSNGDALRPQIHGFRLEQSLPHHGTGSARLRVRRFTERVYNTQAARAQLRHKPLQVFSHLQDVSLRFKVWFLGDFFRFVRRCLQNLKEDFVDYVAKKYGRNFRNRNSTILVVGNWCLVFCFVLFYINCLKYFTCFFLFYFLLFCFPWNSLHNLRGLQKCKQYFCNKNITICCCLLIIFVNKVIKRNVYFI